VRHLGAMQSRCRSRRIEIKYHRSFRRSVKIRNEAEPPRLADWITPFPTGLSLSIASRSQPSRQTPPRVLRVPPPEPDWRIVGEQDAETGRAADGAAV
jgi:hypothetical protein